MTEADAGKASSAASATGSAAGSANAGPPGREKPTATKGIPKHDQCFREVWATNLEEEFRRIRDLLPHYGHVAMDTEFPGVVARPIGNFRSTSDYQYQTLRCNVDLLKIIQLGLTFSDSDGNVPDDVCVWQFNFTFNLNEDMYAQDSIDLLTRSGIDFKRHELFGIDVNSFAELLTSSGLVLSNDITWVSFHSGYDFGYLLKLLTCQALPADEGSFFELLELYFPRIYDIKYLMRNTPSLRGGLQEVAQALGVGRIGPQHQAGSDSLLTLATFFSLQDQYFDGAVGNDYCGTLYGLGEAQARAINGGTPIHSATDSPRDPINSNVRNDSRVRSNGHAQSGGYNGGVNGGSKNNALSYLPTNSAGVHMSSHQQQHTPMQRGMMFHGSSGGMPL